jgi:hypothetical protein
MDFASNDAPTTTAASARRTNIEAGSNTRVCRQPEHYDRRGRKITVSPSSRTPRPRA